LEYDARSLKPGGLEVKRYISALVCVVDINILGESIHTTTRNIDALVVANKEAGLEANAKKIKYMVISREQHA
jgi:hypothetical protein